jgi:glycosyltransferase involved in cell wall biosynthesis
VRVLQVVTLVTPDGAFGGPVRVAENQASALREAGHDVAVAAGASGFPEGGRPTSLGGAPLHLFDVRTAVPGASFSGLLSVGLLRWVRQQLREGRVDVLHVHLARDLVTLPAAELARRSGRPYVVQPHGMVMPTGNPIAPVLDGALTRRVLRGAGSVFHLTAREGGGLEQVARAALPLQLLGNGVPVASSAPPRPDRPEVLFCARLQERKRPLVFVEMAKALLAEGSPASFVLVGPDEGLGGAVQAEVEAFGDPDRLRWEGAIAPSEVLGRMSRATLTVLPSLDEPNGMSLLESMSVGRPVVVTRSCGLASDIEELGAGAVVDETLDDLVRAVRTLLSDSTALAAASAAALAGTRERFGMGPVVATLLDCYALARSEERPPASRP